MSNAIEDLGKWDIFGPGQSLPGKFDKPIVDNRDPADAAETARIRAAAWDEGIPQEKPPARERVGSWMSCQIGKLAIRRRASRSSYKSFAPTRVLTRWDMETLFPGQGNTDELLDRLNSRADLAESSPVQEEDTVRPSKKYGAPDEKPKHSVWDRVISLKERWNRQTRGRKVAVVGVLAVGAALFASSFAGGNSASNELVPETAPSYSSVPFLEGNSGGSLVDADQQKQITTATIQSEETAVINAKGVQPTPSEAAGGNLVLEPGETVWGKAYLETVKLVNPTCATNITAEIVIQLRHDNPDQDLDRLNVGEQTFGISPQLIAEVARQAGGMPGCG